MLIKGDKVIYYYYNQYKKAHFANDEAGVYRAIKTSYLYYSRELSRRGGGGSSNELCYTELRDYYFTTYQSLEETWARVSIKAEEEYFKNIGIETTGSDNMQPA